jgi:hypothetical protein
VPVVVIVQERHGPGSVVGVSRPNCTPLSWTKSRPESRVTSVNFTGGAAAACDGKGNSREKTTPIRMAATAIGTSTGTSGEMAPSRRFPGGSGRPLSGMGDWVMGARPGRAAKTGTDCY